MAEAIRAATAATSSGVSILRTLEEKARVYYERKDLLSDNCDKLVLVQELVQIALEAIARLAEDQGMTRATLGAWKFRIRTLDKKLRDWAEQIRQARFTDRVRRMEHILNEAENEVKEFLLLLWHFEQEQISEQTKLVDDHSACVFRSSGYVPENPPRLTLNYESHHTAEGRLKAAIIKASGRFIAVVASGRGGVGKTCALRGLRSSFEIRLRFPDGVVFLSLGRDANIETVIHQVSKVVKNTGNHNLSKKIRSAAHLQEAVELARIWFRARRCLFLVDDVWAVNGIDGNVFYILSEMMDDHSRLVFSTRDEILAKEAETTVLFEAKEPQGTEARRILLRHTGLKETVILDKKNEDALNDILQACGGVPLLLGAAGAGVREYTRFVTGPSEDALSRYNYDLKNSQASLVRQELLRYGPVRNVVDTSLHVLQNRWDKEQHEWCPMSIRDMHCSLCVLRKQQVAPLSMIRRLWGIKEADTGRVVEVMKAMNDVGIVELQHQSDVEENRPQLKVHDDILEILESGADDDGSRHSYIWRLLGSYCPSEPIEDMGPKTEIQKRSKLEWLCCWKLSRTEENETKENEGTDTVGGKDCVKPIKRDWWSVDDDGYVLENICRLLKEVNEGDQVIRLLFTPQWIVRRLRAYGIFAVENDIAIGIEALNSMPTDEDDDIKWSLRIVSEAARLSVHAVARNPREAYSQLYGRLVHYTSKSRATKKFLDDLEIAAEKPWAKPSIGFLTAAGEATRDGFRLDGRATAMAISGSELIVSYMDRDEAKVAIYDRKFGSLRTISFGSNNQLSSLTNDGTLVAVVDRDGKVSVYESKSGSLMYSLRSRRSYRAVSASLSDDGKWVACVAEDGVGFLWDFENKNERFRDDILLDDNYETLHFGISEECQYSLSRFPESVSYVLVNSASNRFVTSFSSTAELVISSLVPLEINAVPCSELDNVSCMALSPNGKRIATISWDGFTRLWDADVGKELAFCPSAVLDHPQCISMTDSCTIIEGFPCGKIHVWKIDVTDPAQSKVCMREMKHGAGVIRSVAISADGCFACSQSEDGTVRIWNIHREFSNSDVAGELSDSDGTEELTDSGGAGEHVESEGSKTEIAIPHWLDTECISADERLIVRGLADNRDFGMGGIQVWDAERSEMIHQDIYMEGVENVALSANGTRVVYNAAPYLELLKVQQGTVVVAKLNIETRFGTVGCIALSGDGKRVAAGESYTGKIHVWDADSGQPIWEGLEGHEEGVKCVALNENGNRMVSTGVDMTLRVWDVREGRAVAAMRIETSLHRLAIDAQATRVVWASRPEGRKEVSVRVWDALSGSEVSANVLHFGSCNIALALSSDGSSRIDTT